MKLTHSIFLMAVVIFAAVFGTYAQTTEDPNLGEEKLQMVTLYSRIKYKADEGNGRSAFNFSHGKRSDDSDRAILKNNYELLYGNINYNGNQDWLSVTLVTDDRSRIKDLGKMDWVEINDAPYLPVSDVPQKGFRIPVKGNENCEEDYECHVVHVNEGHIYVVHTKDTNTDLYTLFRVDKLVPNDQVTISWKNVRSPEK